MKKTIVTISRACAAVFAAIPALTVKAQEPLAELQFDYMPGDVLPVEFGVADWQEYQTYGLTKAVEGTEWVRVDDDAVLINQGTGEIIYVAYDLDARRISS